MLTVDTFKCLLVSIVPSRSQVHIFFHRIRADLPFLPLAEGVYFSFVLNSGCLRVEGGRC